MTQQAESQCDQHDAVKSALQIPLPLSHKKHPLWTIQYFDYFISKGRYHLCGLSAKMTNDFFCIKRRPESVRYGPMGQTNEQKCCLLTKDTWFSPQNSGKIVSKIVLDQCQYFVTVIEEKPLSFRSDSNSYFPVGPCEYGGPLQALMAGDANAGTCSGFTSWSRIWIIPHPVFLLDEPEKIPRHNLYELVWFLKTGATRSPTLSPPSSSWLLSTRMKRMMLGLEPFVYDFGILTEGYQHYTPWVLWGWGGELQSANGLL